MSIDIFPEKIIKTRGSDGTKMTSEVYSLDTWANLSILGFIVFLAILAALAPVASAIILLFYCLDIHKTPNVLNYLGLLISVYFLIDFHNHWLVSTLSTIVFDKEQMKIFQYLNGAMILAHLIMLFIGEFIYFISGHNRLLSLIYIFIITMFCYLGSIFILGNIIKL